MSKLSTFVKKVKLGPIVTKTVRQVEELFGNGNGALKKKAATEAVSALLRRLKELDLQVPDDVEERIDELIEQAVYILNDTEWAKSSDLVVSTMPTIKTPSVETKTVPVVQPSTGKRRGRKPGSKNRPKEAQSTQSVERPVVLDDFGTQIPYDNFDIDGIDLDLDNE